MPGPATRAGSGPHTQPQRGQSRIGWEQAASLFRLGCEPGYRLNVDPDPGLDAIASRPVST